MCIVFKSEEKFVRDIVVKIIVFDDGCDSVGLFWKIERYELLDNFKMVVCWF